MQVAETDAPSAKMPKQFMDLDQVVKDWAWKEYDRTATKKQKKLREKQNKKGGSYISLTVDWSEVKFRDETTWARLANDAFETPASGEKKNEKNHNDENAGSEEGQVADMAAVGAATPHAGILFHTKFTNNTKAEQEYTMRTEKTTKSTCMTEVENGFTRGIDLSVNLKTPCEILEMNAGYHREVSLTNTEGQEFEEELRWEVESLIKVKAEHVAEAKLVVTEDKKRGDFKVVTRIRGDVYVTFNDIRDNNSFLKSTGHEVAQIVEEYIKQERRKGESMDFVEVQDNVVHITTQGSCQFRFGIRQEVLVDQKPLNGGSA